MDFYIFLKDLLRNSFISKLFLFMFVFVFLACSRPSPLPTQATQKMPWGSVDTDITKDDSKFDIKNSLGNSLKYKIKHSKQNILDFNILAISGGGSQGAYGCGILDGWNKHGDMPKFDVVTGISTGSIISSFVFLGGDNITKISKIYTSIETSDIYYYNFFKIFGGSSITSTAPLKELIKKHITKELLEEVALEYKKGRRLYVGTTNIDSGGLVVWDMTAIAASNHLDKLQLYRDIIYASSAIPGVFDPQYFKVDYKGETYYQMHIDGGMNSYVFMIGMYDNWRNILDISPDIKMNVSIYILANRQYRYKKQTQPLKSDNVISILSAVVKNSVDLIYDRSIYRLYKASKKNGYNFNYVGIDDNITLKYLPHKFKPKEMKRLFLEGYKRGFNDLKWQKSISEYEMLKH